MLAKLIILIDKLIEKLIIFGPIAGFFLIILESIFPILPLGVFIAFNVEAFGLLQGFLLSYAATSIGCIISYYLFRNLLSDYYYNKIAKKKKLKKATKTFANIKFSNLVLVMALPFTPASLVNVIAGITKVPQIKFILAVVISKVFIIYFWGFVGKSLLSSFNDLKTLLILTIILILAYIISKIVSIKMNLE